MARNDAAVWGIIGAIVAIMLVGALDIKIDSILAAIIGAAIGFYLGEKA